MKTAALLAVLVALATGAYVGATVVSYLHQIGGLA